MGISMRMTIAIRLSNHCSCRGINAPNRVWGDILKINIHTDPKNSIGNYLGFCITAGTTSRRNATTTTATAHATVTVLVLLLLILLLAAATTAAS